MAGHIEIAHPEWAKTPVIQERLDWIAEEIQRKRSGGFIPGRYWEYVEDLGIEAKSLMAEIEERESASC